ncbi:MAG: DsbA family protein [Deltaproteobacteria bacterium]
MKNETLILIFVAVALGFNAWTLREVRTLKKEMAVGKQIAASTLQEVQRIKSAGPGAPKGAEQPPAQVRVSIDDDPMKGDIKAPITIIEFSEYQCPFCKKFHEQTLPAIESEYIAKGKVRYVFRDYPLAFHQKARPAAIVANCAGEQGKYWEANDFLFKNPDKLDIAAALGSAGELGLDYAKFEACLKDEPRHNAEITADFEDGQRYGVKGTPSFFIGKTEEGKEMTGFYIRGAQPLEAFKTQIDTLLGGG